MKKAVLILGITTSLMFGDFNVTHAEPIYDIIEECTEVHDVSPAGTAVGGVVGGATGAVVGRALFGRGWGSAIGGLVGTGVGASVGGNTKSLQCTTSKNRIGYYNYYIKDGNQLVKFDKNKLVVIEE